MNFSSIRKAMSLSNLIDRWFNDAESREFFRNTCFAHSSFLSDFNNYWHGNVLCDKLLSKESRWSQLYAFVEEAYPELKNEVSMEWIKVGLSVKKDAGLAFTKWKYNNDISNPFYQEDKPTYIYYYLTLSETSIFWAIFDRSHSRNKPIKTAII